nr:T9SS type A sorting domain-containing protein [Bacteroidales bacterium]
IQAMGVVVDLEGISIDDVVVVSAKVYPSIVTTDVTVEAAEIISVSIVGLDGKTITVVDAQGENAVVVPTTSLVQGTYLVKVVTSQGIVVKQIVK